MTSRMFILGFSLAWLGTLVRSDGEIWDCPISFPDDPIVGGIVGAMEDKTRLGALYETVLFEPRAPSKFLRTVLVRLPDPVDPKETRDRYVRYLIDTTRHFVEERTVLNDKRVVIAIEDMQDGTGTTGRPLNDQITEPICDEEKRFCYVFSISVEHCPRGRPFFNWISHTCDERPKERFDSWGEFGERYPECISGPNGSDGNEASYPDFVPGVVVT